jgi:rhodanese-related sulfurtransferase
MTFPFESLTTGSRELGLVVAVLIGVAFGFVLERSGFGRAPKLAAQFYLRDMTVFKVMFTAIVTAMLGLVVTSAFGLTNIREISESIASWTYVWPMLIGGFVLGAGFIVSGYCPGTSIVAAASGNIDGAVTVAGVVTGTFVYSELMQIPAFHQFHNSGDKGAWFLYDLVKVPPQLLAAIIAIAALLAFVGAEKVEKLVAGEGAVLLPRGRRFAFAAVVALAAFALITIAIPATSPAEATASPEVISAAGLAQRVVREPWRLRVIDVRDEPAFAAARVPGSENARVESLADIAQMTAPSGRTLVVVGPAKRIPLHAKLLAGGFDAWKSYALTPPGPPAPGAPQAQVDDYLFRVALNQSLTGSKVAAAAVPAPAAGGFTKPKKKGGGCSS